MSTQLNELIKSLSAAINLKRQQEALVKETEQDIARIEMAIREAMDAQGLIETKSEVGKVVLSSSVYPKVENWDHFAEFIYENRYLHLLERRPAVLAYRELLTLGRNVPGVLPFTKRKVSFKEN